MRSLEISTQGILHNFIKQNQKLSSDSVLNHQCPESTVQRRESRAQHPEFSVQHLRPVLKNPVCRKNLKYFKIKENLRSENSTEYYL